MNLGEVFQLSYWQSGVVFSFLLISLILVIFLNKKIKWSNLILYSVLIGIIGGLIIFGLNQSTADIYWTDLVDSEGNPLFESTPNQGEIVWHPEALIWLNIFPSMFVSLMLFFVPFLVFVNIFLALTKSRVSTKFFVKTILSFAFFVIIASIIALALWPVFSRVDFGDSTAPPADIENSHITIPGSIVGWIPTSISIFADSVFVMSCIIMAVFFAIIVNILAKDHHKRAEGIIAGMTNFQTLINTCLKYIIKLIPMVIISKLPALFVKDIAQNFSAIGIYLIGFFVGVFVIMLIMAFIQLLCKPKAVSTKDVFTSKQEPLTFAFFSQSSMATVPLTTKALDKLGVDESISTIIPSMGASMGVIICAAFYPISIAIVTISNTGDFGTASSLATFIVLLFIITIVSSFGVAGVPGTATAATTTVLGGVGLPLTYYTFFLAIDPLIDMFRTMGNVDAIIANSLLLDKIHKSGNQTKKLAEEIFIEFEYQERLEKQKKEDSK